MANAVIKHFRRYEYLISNDVITLAKTKVEITSAFSGSLRMLINRKKMTSARALEMCQKLIDFRVLSIIGTPLAITLLFQNEISPLATPYHSSPILMSMQSLKKIGQKALKLEHGNEARQTDGRTDDGRTDGHSKFGGYNMIIYIYIYIIYIYIYIYINAYAKFY